MILTIRTDKPEAEIGIFTAKGEELGNYTWLAHRELSNTLLSTIRDQLAAHKADMQGISGIAVFTGPGSFTGLRIGITVANTLAYGLKVPIIGRAGENWKADGVTALVAGQNDQLVLPTYGAEAHITMTKK